MTTVDLLEVSQKALKHSEVARSGEARTLTMGAVKLKNRTERPGASLLSV